MTENVPLSHLMSVVITTSPVRSDPCVDLIVLTLSSLDCVGLAKCPVYIFADKFHENEAGKALRHQRNGCVSREMLEAYEERLQRLEKLVEANELPWTKNCTVIRLEAWHGFGWATKAALDIVRTPLICMIQHDLTFQRSVPIRGLVNILLSKSSTVNCVTLSRSKTQNYRHAIRSRCGIDVGPPMSFSVDGGPVDAIDDTRPPQISISPESELSSISAGAFEASSNTLSLSTESLNAHGSGSYSFSSDQSSTPASIELTLLPQFFDSTHFARVDWYSALLCSPLPDGSVLKQGQFTEDVVGTYMLTQAKAARTSSAVADFGVWLFDDFAGTPLVNHVDGRKFLTQSQLEKVLSSAQTPSPSRASTALHTAELT